MAPTDTKARPKDSTTGHQKWVSQVEFLLSCIGYAVGVANVWRFPYLCMKNGGGAFLIPYFLTLFLIGIPLFFLEISVGQYGSVTPVSMWKLCPLLKGLGWCTVLICISLATYYNILSAWILYYLAMSFKSPLPWVSCNNPWNTDACLTRVVENITNVTSYGNNITLPDNHARPVSYNLTQEKVVSPTEEFWHHHVLDISDGIDHPNGLRWQLVLCHISTWILLALATMKGIRSSGKVVYVTVILPYILLVILLVRGCTLPGSLDGIFYYISPKWHRLKDAGIWVEACLQVFYSLGPGWGSMINFASHNKFNNNVKRDAFIISCVNCGTSFFGGFAIFSIVGYMAHLAGLPVDKVITSGPGLAFIVYPEALGSLPVPQLWSVLFFLMLISLTFDTQMGNLECILSCFRDEFSGLLTTKWRARAMTASLIGAQMLVGLLFCTRAGMYFFHIWDWYMAAFSVIIVTCVESLVMSWVYGWDRFSKDIAMMTGSPPSIIYRPLWGVIIPAILILLFLYNCVTFTAPKYGDYQYPAWANAFGWCIGIVVVIPIPYYIVKILYKSEGRIWERFKESLRPASDWGPKRFSGKSEEAVCDIQTTELLMVEKA